MRKTLEDVTKERDELVRKLAKANTQDANTNDALQLMTEKATSSGEELDIARKKMKEDEEQIALLRTKVEESR
jgi:chromosome segregation ATPase